MSELEDEFELQMKAVGITDYVREHKFTGRSGETRRFRFDFAWPARLIAMEVDGGSFNGGRHTRPMGFAKDIEKFNLATMEKWRMLRCDQAMVKDGRALDWIIEALEKL